MNSQDKNLVIVRAVVGQGMTPLQTANRFGVTRQWLYALIGRYKAEGRDGLAPRRRAPKSHPGTTVAAEHHIDPDRDCQRVSCPSA